MRAVKSRGNRSTEIKLIEFFRKNKITGWRRNQNLYGKPDFVFPKKNLALFADGCFWHGHNCRNLRPRENADYWNEKIERNKKRDKKVKRILQSKGWKVFRVFECKIKTEKLPVKFLEFFSSAAL